MNGCKLARWAAGAACAGALLAATLPAFAVDRSEGAGVPRPVVTGTPWTAGEIAGLAANVDRALGGAKTLRGAHAGLYAIDARDGRVLYQRNGDDLFQPASTLKLIVGSAALDRLGPDFRFGTSVIANGPVAAGELRGALLLRGGGDPFLATADLDAAAAAVAAAGITRVAGGLTIDDGRYEPPGYLPGWNWDDLPFYYAPVVSALTFEENVVHLTVAPGLVAGAPAIVTAAPVGTIVAPPAACAPAAAIRIVPATVLTAAAGAKDTVEVERTPGGCIAVVGAIPLGARPDTIDAAVPSPAIYAHDAFAAALARRGVALAGPARDEAPIGFEYRVVPPPDPAATVVWSHRSEPLRDVLADLWLPSDNLVAELLLRELSAAAGDAPGTTAGGIAVERRWLASMGIDPDGAALVDGSGLSTYDRISAHDLVTVLRHDWDGPHRMTILDDLPVAGVRGSLRRSFAGTAAERRVFAKTGSFSHVNALAGYVANPHHGAVIFAFQIDDWIGAPADLRALRGRVLSLFAGG